VRIEKKTKIKRLDMIEAMTLGVDLKSLPFWITSSSLAESTTI
tara:strand:- start:214 stop:342 length:129 start_codon:yes stop_codon:yes gene_type:complete